MAKAVCKGLRQVVTFIFQLCPPFSVRKVDTFTFFPKPDDRWGYLRLRGTLFLQR